MPCLACQKDGISPCIKRWGKFKESTITTSNANVSQLESTGDFVPDLPRPPPTPIDAVITNEEVHLLQYVYSVEFNPLWGPLLSGLLSLLRSVYGNSISCPSIRSSLLSYSNVLLFTNYGLDKYGQTSVDHGWRANRALIRKHYSSFDAEEFYTILLLALSESLRSYVLHRRFRNSDACSLQRLGVHMKGMMAILKHLKRKASMAGPSIPGELYRSAPPLLGICAAIGDPVTVLIASSYYRRECLDDMQGEENVFLRPILGASLHYAAFCRLRNALLRIYLEQFLEADGSKHVHHDAIIAELNECCSLRESLAEDPFLKPNKDEYEIWYLSYLVLSGVKLEWSISSNSELGTFYLAEALVISTIRCYNQWSTFVANPYWRLEEVEYLCKRIGIAALIIPLETNITRTIPFVQALLTIFS